jgi:hypothetical protein
MRDGPGQFLSYIFRSETRLSEIQMKKNVQKCLKNSKFKKFIAISQISLLCVLERGRMLLN